jgi:hypothetical protein
MPATPAYRLLGTNDDTDTCEVCGKPELRRVMALQPLDDDGTPDGDVIYAGTTCGARMLTRSLGRRVTATLLLYSNDAIGRALVDAREWAREFAYLPEARFLVANSLALLRRNNDDMQAAIADGKALHAATVAEARKLLHARTGADLIGTRFESRLPKL